MCALIGNKPLQKLLIVLLLVLSNVGYAQIKNIIDSLKQVLPATQGVDRFNTLNGLAWEYRFAYPDSTIHFARLAYEYGLTLKEDVTLALPLNYMGIAYNYNGDRLKSLEYHQKAIDAALTQGDSSSVAHAYNSIGRVYFEQGMVQQSIDYFIKSQKLFEGINDKSGMAYVYQSLGNLYRTQGDFKNTLEFYTRALELRRALGNKRNIMAAIVLLGRLYQDQQQLDKSNELFLEGEAIGQAINDEIQVAEIEMFLAQNYLKSHQLDLAEQYCLRANKAITKVNNIRMLPSVTITLGQIYLEQKKVKEANDLFKKALDLATQTKDAVSQRDAYFWLWKLAVGRGEEVQAIRFQNQFLIMRDSTSNLELAREVDRLQFQLRMEQIDKENSLLRESELRNEALIEQQRLQNLMLIIAVTATAAIVLLQWNNNRRRKTINQKLAQQNDEILLRNQQLSELNHEKDTLMNIMVHDLRAPLNNIKGLTSLVEMDGSINTNQTYYLKLIKDSTDAGLEMITDLLDAHAIESGEGLNLEEINVQEFLTHRVNTFMKAAAEKEVTVEINADHTTFTTDKGYLARILDNLISNAIKFSPKGKMIWVTAKDSNDKISFSIKDQGLGFSDTDKRELFKKFKKLSSRPTAGESSNGLGLAIVKILVDRLNGTITLHSEKNNGSEFVIALPKS